MNSQTEFSLDGAKTVDKEHTLTAVQKLKPAQQMREATQNILQQPYFARARRAPKIVQSAFFGVLFATAIFILVIGTLLSFSQVDEQVSRAYRLLQFNLGFILTLAFYLVYRVWINLFARGTEHSAPVLHRRFVLIFSLSALAPALIVGAFLATLISQNISGIFGDNVRSNMVQAQSILDDYVRQEFEELGKDMIDLKVALSQSQTQLDTRITFIAELRRFARVKELDAIYVIGSEGFVLTRVEAPGAPPLKLPSPSLVEGLGDGEIGFQARGESNYLIAITPLDKTKQTYLYIGQVLRSNNEVLSSLTGIQNATAEMAKFNADQSRMNKIFGLTFIETALLILMAAIWLGLVLANRIIDPLSGLINAAERVRGGDMSARVDVKGQWGEIADLGSAFNRMTQQLNSQRDELVREHDLSEQRRQFSEAVLSGVRAGVIGLNQNGRITLLNQSARNLLGPRAKTLLQRPIADVLPEFAPAFVKARENITSSAEDQVTVEIEDIMRTFDLRVSAYEGVRKDTGWVLTFDDMTRLVSAQRHSAWREVARRIAHEIKNPLTPIQLSAERLSRKYTKEITSDPETFKNCTQTILRQVGSLEQMVNAFSAFARMPAPEFAPLDLFQLIDNLLFEEGVSFPDIRFDMQEAPELKGWQIEGDERLLTQALTNIYKNAGEAVLRFQDASGEDDHTGVITTYLSAQDNMITISIADNGPGWPLPDTERLLEPYVTTRESGTGLGLAIVKRIAEDHGGRLSLASPADGQRGAIVHMHLPATSPVKTHPPTDNQVSA